MGLWLLHLPVLAMGAIILVLVYVGTAIIYWAVMSLARDERRLRAFKAISPGMLPPISVVFALLRLRRGASSVWVEVFDHDLRLPRIRTAGAEDEGGRGLYLVDQLAERWGSRPTPDGKAVWFQIPMHQPDSE